MRCDIPQFCGRTRNSSVNRFGPFGFFSDQLFHFRPIRKLLALICTWQHDCPWCPAFAGAFYRFPWLPYLAGLSFRLDCVLSNMGDITYSRLLAWSANALLAGEYLIFQAWPGLCLGDLTKWRLDSAVRPQNWLPFLAPEVQRDMDGLFIGASFGLPVKLMLERFWLPGQGGNRAHGPL